MLKSKSKFKHIIDKQTLSRKAERFLISQRQSANIGPGEYSIDYGSFGEKSKLKKNYMGSRNSRFPERKERAHLGPGTYDANYDFTKERRVNDIVL